MDIMLILKVVGLVAFLIVALLALIGGEEGSPPDSYGNGAYGGGSFQGTNVRPVDGITRKQL